MTPKQIERIKNKITRIKKELSYDKQRNGGYYDDSRGIRYLAPCEYLKLRDYKGALRYFNWFHKNFPNDSCHSFFLFEWSITLFKNGKIKDAEKKALETFFLNTYLIDKFFEKEFLELEISENASWDKSMLENYFKYSHKDIELSDFSAWLASFVSSEIFHQYVNEFADIERSLKKEPAGPIRTELVDKKYHLLDHY